MREWMIVVAFFGWLFGRQQPVEKQALAIAQRVPVSDLDRALPGSPFSSWFEQAVGRKSGVIWQLGECGQTIDDPTLASTQDSVGKSDSPLPPPPQPQPSTSPEAPGKTQPSTGSTTANQASKENAQKGVVLQGPAITRVQPIYLARARTYNASREVRVQVDICETGCLTKAKAIIGHPLLRDGAMDAARKWVFKPTTLDGVPVTTLIVLKFDFTEPD
jgi:Gram-negative bacterial TonB protein C-terminal